MFELFFVYVSVYHLKEFAGRSVLEYVLQTCSVVFINLFNYIVINCSVCFCASFEGICKQICYVWR